MGNYTLVAVATDSFGIKTTSAPITVTVDTPPTVTINSPADGAVFPSLTNISVSAIAHSGNISIAKVDFYANQTLVGTASDTGTDRFAVTWRHLSDGLYTLTAVATDSLGISSTSPAITIGVNTPSPQPGEFIWFDDDLPAGAVKHADGDVDWYWVNANPVAFSGIKAHQSRSFGQVESNSVHQHYFDGATATLPVNVGDKLFTYVFLDINNLPREIMLQWKDASGWDHRAYWGENRINYGSSDPNVVLIAAHMGPLPQAGTWARLEVPANLVGLEGKTLNGMAFTLDAGRATFDLAGKTTANAPPRPTTPPGEFIWVDDAPPAGAILENQSDQWQWLPPHKCGSQGHRSFFTVNQGAGQFRSHSFRNATNTMTINPGDILFTWVFLDPNNLPDELMLQWNDGSSWEHRAFWGENYIGQKVSNIGVQGTESQRYMGGLPPGNEWFKLEVPASYVGLEGKTVSGMSFGFYSTVDHAGINWDCSGKSAKSTTTPLPLLATAGVWRFKSKQGDYAYDTNDQGPPQHSPQKIAFYVNPNQAAGTVPFYRFHSQDFANYFYSRCSNCTGANWIPDGIAFYVYPDGTTPGTVPLFLYHDSVFHYFLTTDQTEAAGMTFDGPWAYVLSLNPEIPAAPTAIGAGGCCFSWLDNSATETGFRLEGLDTNTGVWNLMGSVGANVGSYCTGGDLCIWRGKFRVQAFNEFGNSNYSNVVDVGPVTSAAERGEFDSAEPANSLPYVNIVGPGNGDGVDRNFAITANSFDLEGNGTIVKVEFFANGIKLGEIADAPYVFVWNNAPAGTYSLTATATDNFGATTTSNPVSVTVLGAANITVNGYSGVYDGHAHGATGSASGANGEDLSSWLNLGTTFTDAPGGTAHWTFAGNGNYAPAGGDVSITITPRAANISVSGFTGTFDGQAHGASGSVTGVNGESLNSLLNLGSSFTNPPGGTAHWTFAGNNNYNASSGDVAIVINKATPVVTWNKPTDIATGTALTNAQLNATANVAGTFAYSPPAGTVLNVAGTQQLSVTFTPTDSSNYNSATATVQINVLLAVLLSDDFNDNSLDASKWSVVDPNSPAAVTEQSQQLRIALPPNTAAYNGVVSVFAYDLRGATVETELAQPISQAGWCENFIEAALDANNYFLIDAGAGSMVFRSMVNGVNDQTILSVFDPSLERYWRIRHDQISNTIYFETSPDRVVWTTRKTVTAGFSLAALRFYLYAGAWGTGNGSPGAAKWDNFQLSLNETATSLPINNNGFELPVQSANAFQYGPTNAGWSFLGAGVSANNSGFTASNPPAPERNQVAFLQGGSPSSISQAISGFQSNVSYVVRFFAAQRANFSNGGQDFQVFLDSVLLGVFRPSSMGYIDYSTSAFTTTAGTHTLKFVGLNTAGGDNTAFIDNVRVTKAAGLAQPGVVLADDFNTASLNVAKWSVTDANRVTDNGQQLQISLLPNTSGYYGAYSNQTYDLTGRMAQVEVTQPISQGGWCENYIEAVLDGNNYFLIDAGAGSMVFRSMVGGVNDQTIISFDATAEHFWRLRHDAVANTISFETSADGNIWTTRKTATVGFSLTSLRFYIYAGAWGTGNSAPGAAKYDNFQLLSSANVFSDEFNRTPLDAGKWGVADPNSSVVVSDNGQQLQITPQPSTSAYNGVYSNSTYDLTGRMVQVELTQPISQAGWCENFIEAALDGNNYFLIDAGSGSMVFRSMVGGANNQTLLPTFDPATQRFWRIRHDAVTNTIFFETSADGNAWTTRKTASVGFSLTSIRFYVYAGAWGTGNGAPGSAKFDNFQLFNSPYGGVAQNVPGTIEIENYDNGGGEAAYHDTTPGSHGQDYDQPNYPVPTFRLPTDVDLYKSAASYSNGYLTIVQAGDWMKYSVNVNQPGSYTLYARIAWGGTPGGTFHIEVDGVDKTGPLQIPDTSWGLAFISKSGVPLTSGMHTFKIVADTNGASGYTGDIDYLYFRSEQ